MEEKRKFEKYQDFINKRKLNLTKERSNNNIKIENKTEPYNYRDNNQSKNVIESCIDSLKAQINNNNKQFNNTSYKNYRNRNIDSSTKSKRVINQKMNLTNNYNCHKEKSKENKNNKSYRYRYSDKLLKSDKIKNKSVNKIGIDTNNNNNFSQNNLRYNFSSDFTPMNNKELDHIISSYNFKNNDNGDLNSSTKIQFKNLLSLVNELKAKNELLKKELRSKDKIISLLENKCLNKNKNGIRDKKNMENIIMNEYNSDILLDNQKLKSEILNLNKKLENQRIHYEDIIKDYKSQLNQEKNKSNVFEGNFKEMENRCKTSNDRLVSMEDDLEEAILKKSKLEDINQKYEIININQQKRIENLENQLNVILTLVKGLFNKENELLYPMRTKLFYEISNLNNIYK
jgi:hypothetical protein